MPSVDDWLALWVAANQRAIFLSPRQRQPGAILQFVVSGRSLWCLLVRLSLMVFLDA